MAIKELDVFGLLNKLDMAKFMWPEKCILDY